MARSVFAIINGKLSKMKKLIINLFVIVMLYPFSICAEEKSLQDQLDEIKIMIEREQIRNIELKAELAKKEQEAEELKQKLQEIEDEINDLKAKHNLN
jgi:septal ring factor EnvC (AmiA/AmiB activator)